MPRVFSKEENLSIQRYSDNFLFAKENIDLRAIPWPNVSIFFLLDKFTYVLFCYTWILIQFRNWMRNFFNMLARKRSWYLWLQVLFKMLWYGTHRVLRLWMWKSLPLQDCLPRSQKLIRLVYDIHFPHPTLCYIHTYTVNCLQLTINSSKGWVIASSYIPERQGSVIK